MFFVCFAAFSPIGLNIFSLRYMFVGLSYFICVVRFCCLICFLVCVALFSLRHTLLICWCLVFFFAFFFRVDPFGSQYLSPQLHCTVSGVLTEFQLVSTWFTSDNHPGLSNVHAHNAKLAAFFVTLLRSQSPVTLVNCVTGVTQIVWNPALSDHRFYSKFRCKFQLLSCLHPWRYSYLVLRKEFLPILRLNLLEFENNL